MVLFCQVEADMQQLAFAPGNVEAAQQFNMGASSYHGRKPYHQGGGCFAEGRTYWFEDIPVPPGMADIGAVFESGASPQYPIESVQDPPVPGMADIETVFEFGAPPEIPIELVQDPLIPGMTDNQLVCSLAQQFTKLINFS
ncbi:h/aca ribonucleoprotein complex non-core subunit naf1 [Fagus crenata]